MSENRTLLLQTAVSAFEAATAEATFDAGWKVLDSAGFPTLMLPESAGGFGGDWGDFFGVLRQAGYCALPFPLGEAILAARLLHDAGVTIPSGMLTFADTARGTVCNASFTGELRSVPWGRSAEWVVATVGGQLLLLSCEHARRVPAMALAEEPRDTLHFDAVPVVVASSNARLRELGAFLRVAQTAGAMSHILELTAQYVGERVQFGKQLAKFQAVQQNLAILASETAAVEIVGHAAAISADRHDACFEIAAAKIRANIAIGQGVGIAHQLHGAIGFTHEFPLHPLTRRLLFWRSEFGNELYWSDILGRMAVKCGGKGLWEELCKRSDAT